MCCSDMSKCWSVLTLFVSISALRDISPKYEHSVIIYSPSCCSKPVWLAIWYRFGMTWGWVNDDNIHFWLNYKCLVNTCTFYLRLKRLYRENTSSICACSVCHNCLFVSTKINTVSLLNCWRSTCTGIFSFFPLSYYYYCTTATEEICSQQLSQ